MKKLAYHVDRWDKGNPPSASEVLDMAAQLGLSGYQWSNGPGDVYGAHRHSFDKIIFVLQGSITFGLPAEGVQVIMNAGDRLDLSRDTLHNAVVGPAGVSCLEIHR